MIEITHKSLFAKTVADALVKVDSNTALNSGMKIRWINALAKAVVMVEENGDWLTWMPENNVLLIWSESNEIYEANGICSCKAYNNGFPCRHRAAAKLLKNYFEMLEAYKGTVEVPLSQGKVAIIDAEDAPMVFQHKWTVQVDNTRQKKTYYARRSIWSKEKQRTVLLHRVIIGAPDGLQVDHKNGDGLDNRKSNLRLATNSQNHINIVRENKTGFRGVCGDKKRFAARIRIDGKQINIGNFETAEEAARAYDAKAKEMHGEFAILNFPENQPPQSKGASAAPAPAVLDITNAPYFQTSLVAERKRETFGGVRV